MKPIVHAKRLTPFQRQNRPKTRVFCPKTYGNYDIPGRSADVTVIYSLARNSAFTIVADERQAACRQDSGQRVGTWIDPDGESKGNGNRP
ncbi:MULTISPECIES: hypothetical protein [Paraburkholderia]|jgi:hypothetical protein|uniref:hypothetical protein n=1 Tax=Paraburkholderia TaxID=1822464 RepID=UPI0015D9AA92|nr:MULTISPECIES: hypothetical protein [Paraburkholderia]GJH03037.1 hypothetical protein CBA19C8_20790 [Paraburkholderia terrae]CAG9259732.1 hypothetical protein PCAR4_470014 [Paraburkholderia caribensis]